MYVVVHGVLDPDPGSDLNTDPPADPDPKHWVYSLKSLYLALHIKYGFLKVQLKILEY